MKKLMGVPKDPGVFESALPFDTARIGAVAISCSDGRYGEQVDDFLQVGLGLPRYDRLAIPGGAAALTGNFLLYHEEDYLSRELRFLIETHQLGRVILVAHQDCGFYKERLRVSESARLALQCSDLGRAADRVRRLSPLIQVERYLATIRDGRVRFEPVP